jgi:hypothetical protein
MRDASDRLKCGEKDALFLAVGPNQSLPGTFGACANLAIRTNSVQNAAVMDLLHRAGHLKALTHDLEIRYACRSDQPHV